MSRQLMVERRAGLIEAEVDGELIGLHIDNGACYGFNATATRIWRLIEVPRSLPSLCEALTGEFAVSPGDCRAQVMDLLLELQREGLVQLVEGPPAA
jgi:hypothetical protein